MDSLASVCRLYIIDTFTASIACRKFSAVGLSHKHVLIYGTPVLFAQKYLLFHQKVLKIHTFSMSCTLKTALVLYYSRPNLDLEF